MTAEWKFLDYRNRQDGSLNQDDLPDPDCESGPVSFPDEDTPVKIVFSASLADFVKMLSALEKGAQLSYPDEWHNVWWTFVKNWECQVTICDEVALCLTEENPAVVEALSQLLQNNPTIRNAINAANAANGGSTPGAPITEEQAQQDFLPDNVMDGEECDLNALWGACLYLVQSANRAITDVFEQLEVASNTIEAMAIAAETIPAAGNYVSAAAQFADQLAENIAEGYAGAYTEEYEEQMACLLFCLARTNCALDLERVLGAIGERLDFNEALLDFGVLMTTVGAGTWSGDSIADVSFWTYFAALRFGQVFGSTVGVRPLTVLMSLGADQLASDNWTVLCECPEIECNEYDFRTSDYSGVWAPRVVSGDDYSVYSPGVGFAPVERGTGNFQNQIYILDGLDCAALEVIYTAPDVPEQAIVVWVNSDFSVYSPFYSLELHSGTWAETIDLTAFTPAPGATGIALVSGNSVGDIDNVVTWQQANFG